MAGVSTPELAAAVSNAGALGSIAIGASSVAKAQEMITQTKSLTDHSFTVNVFCHRTAVADSSREAAWLVHLKPFFDEFQATPPKVLIEPYKSFIDNRPMLEMLLSERPPVVSFHFGLPPIEWIQALKAAGIVTFACATSLAEAHLIEESGVDALVAQGCEAGGHRGVFEPEREVEKLDTMTLVKAIAAHSRLPIIAAGGIMDGQGMAQAMKEGACAVQLGTAFILCLESSANEAFRIALKSDRSRFTAFTSAISGRAARGIVNRMYTEVGTAVGAPAVPDYPIAYDAGKALSAAAAAKGNHDFAVHWAGQGAPLARELPAAELVAVLTQEYMTALT